MKNIRDLRNSLLSNYDAIENNEMSLKKAKEMSNCAGKVIQSLKVEVEYRKLKGTKDRIDFLED